LPLFIFIDVFYSVYNLIKQVYKIYEFVKLKRTILKLQDYIDESEDNGEDNNVPKFVKPHENNCICLEEVKEGKRLPCGHILHLHCIK